MASVQTFKSAQDNETLFKLRRVKTSINAPATAEPPRTNARHNQPKLILVHPHSKHLHLSHLSPRGPSTTIVSFLTHPLAFSNRSLDTASTDGSWCIQRSISELTFHCALIVSRKLYDKLYLPPIYRQFDFSNNNPLIHYLFLTPFLITVIFK